MNTRIKEEPALALALVQAVIALAVSFGLSMSPEQVGAILASVAAAAALFLRQRVTPTPAVAEPVEQTTALS